MEEDRVKAVTKALLTFDVGTRVRIVSNEHSHLVSGQYQPHHVIGKTGTIIAPFQGPKPLRIDHPRNYWAWLVRLDEEPVTNKEGKGWNLCECDMEIFID